MTPARTEAAELTPANRAHEIAAIIALIKAAVFPAPRLSALLEHLGSAVTLLQLPESHPLFAMLAGQGEVIGAVKPEDLARSVREAEEWLGHGLDVRTVLD